MGRYFGEKYCFEQLKKLGSTSPSGGNLVDGLPPVSRLILHRIAVTISPGYASGESYMHEQVDLKSQTC